MIFCGVLYMYINVHWKGMCVRMMLLNVAQYVIPFLASVNIAATRKKNEKK
jgi:lipoate-protein ligase B